MMVEVKESVLLDVAPELLPGVQEIQPVHRHLGTPFLVIHGFKKKDFTFTIFLHEKVTLFYNYICKTTYTDQAELTILS